MLSRAWTWVTDRFGLTPIWEVTLGRRVPKTPWYFGDGAALLLLFTVLVATGAVMTLTYAPSPDAAYLSVRHITEEQPLGWLVRALHYWAAGLMVVMLVWHVLRVVLVAGYKSPREGTWLVGVLIFFGIVVMSFTGYLLRWDERAIHAVRVSLHMFHRVPVIGDALVVLVQGGEEAGSRLLTRLYSVHVIFTPLLLYGLLGLHLYLVLFQGTTTPREREEPVATAEEQRALYAAQKDSETLGEPFFPDTAFQSGVMAFTVLAVVVALAVGVGPAPLYPHANLVEPSFPVEEWWFWWYSALIALLPPAVAPWFVVAFPVALFVAMVALPFVDRSPARGMKRRPLAVVFVIAVVAALAGLSGLRLRSPWTAWPDPAPPPVPAGVVLSPEAEEGRHLFARFGCNSCHAVAGQGRQVAVDLARTERRWSRDEYRRFILKPPDDVAMPRYRGRLTEGELERLLDYVHAAQTFPRQARPARPAGGLFNRPPDAGPERPAPGAAEEASK
ncbi:MAG: cytochrome b N-terminal domain-containing protein [Planctomycetota bacterium]|nr:cytochrome b N-terminal domain-containing protein [Planctomycetota bacterium]